MTNNDLVGNNILSSVDTTSLPWLDQLMARLGEEQQLVAMLPLRGGHGLAALHAAHVSSGSSLLVFPDEQTRTQRMQLAVSLGLAPTVWGAGEGEPGTLSFALLADFENGTEAPSTRPQVLILDGVGPQSKLPSVWSLLTEQTSVLVLPVADHPSAWWHQEESKLTFWQHDVEGWNWKWGENVTHLQDALETLPEDSLVVGSGSLLKTLTLKDGIRSLPLEQTEDALSHAGNTLFAESPKSFHNLAPFARCTQGQLSFHLESEEKAPLSQGAELTEKLAAWLFSRAEEAKAELLYENSQQLLEALRLPTTPEREFERSLERLQASLEHLQQQGVLHSWREVYFQTKIHNTRRFKEAFLLDFPPLLQFWKDYEALKETMGLQESLTLSFFDGREVDLLKLSSRMNYTLGELNQLFRELDERELLVNALQNKAHSHRHEFELHLSPAGKTSRAFQLWLASGDTRKALLRAALSTRSLPSTSALRKLWSRKRPTAAHWLAAWQLLESIEGEADRLSIAGRLLQWQEREERDGGWMLWVLWAGNLSLPQLRHEEIVALLPDLRDADPALEGPLAALLSEAPGDTEGLDATLASLPPEFSLDWLGEEALASQLTAAMEAKAWEKAYKLGSLLAEFRPESGPLLRSMTECSVQLGRRLEVLQWALKANRVDPNRYPIQPALDELREHLFEDLPALREALIELPAHPAFSKLEEELSARESLERELRPVLKELEELLSTDQWKLAREKVSSVLQKHEAHAPFRFLHIQKQLNEKETSLRQALSQEPTRDRRAFNAAMEETSKEALRLGFDDLAREALEHLVKHNPNYGLGYLKLARMTREQGARDRAFRKAVQLSKNAQQQLRNVEEFGDVLVKENRLDALVPLLLGLLDENPGRARQLEPFLLRIIDKSPKQEKIAKQVNGLLERHNGRLKLPRVEKALKKFEDLDPWKRALLNIQAKR